MISEKKQLAIKNKWKEPEYRENQKNSTRAQSIKKNWEKRSKWFPIYIDNITEKLSENSGKYIWFTCKECGIGILTQYRIYIKSNKLCRSCNAKKQWKNDEYRKKQNQSNRSNKAQKSTEELKKTCKRYGYQYLGRKKYRNKHTIIVYKCNNGHIQEKRLSAFTAEIPGCYKCSQNSSYDENRIAKYIKNLDFKIIENDRNIIQPYELDIVIPEKKLAIEYCGLYWHSELSGKDNTYHLNKLNLCNEKGYRLITIFEDEWLNKEKIVKNRLKHILGLNNNKLYARKCIIQEIDTKTAKEFIDKYHLQGYAGSSIKLGAFYDNILVAVITFSKPSISKGRKEQNKKIYEISRFCLSISIIGIASKFLKYFMKNYDWFEIFTFADRRWDTGKVYEKIGFEKIGYTKPNYWYFYGSDKKRLHRFNFRKNILENKLNFFDAEKTEWENMKENGWNRIWDCGNIKFIKGE